MPASRRATAGRAPSLDRDLVARLYRQARAERWSLPVESFAAALEASAAHAGTGHDQRRALEALHLEDLALACACAAGSETAWEHFVRELRPSLYRAADALDRSGGARELADSLYAELFGLRERDGTRQSLFTYFHGRSSLATWLRAVLSQRFVDRARTARRTVPLPDEPAPALAAPVQAPDPNRQRWLTLLLQALTRAVSVLADRDRLRLVSYYAREMTLAQIGRLLGEHEATVSRHLTRTRRLIRADVERQLRDEAGLRDDEIDACFESVVTDAGPLDLARLFALDTRKESDVDRSDQESHAGER